MIKIEIVNPHEMSKDVLRRTAEYLLACGGDELIAAPVPTPPIAVPPAPAIDENTPFAINVTFDQAEDEPESELEIPTAELDSAGRPWDARIHTKVKTKTVNGQWKLLRGVKPALVKQVQAEQDKSKPTQKNVVPPPPAQTTFPMVMERITNAIRAGHLAHSDIVKIVNDLGVASIPMIQSRPDLFDLVIDHIEAKING